MATQELSGTFDLDGVLKRARQIYSDLAGLPEVPCSLRPLIGNDGEDYWDRFRDVNFSCFECSGSESGCDMKKTYLSSLKAQVV